VALDARLALLALLALRGHYAAQEGVAGLQATLAVANSSSFFGISEKK
jgi:hypothetical protein